MAPAKPAAGFGNTLTVQKIDCRQPKQSKHGYSSRRPRDPAPEETLNGPARGDVILRSSVAYFVAAAKRSQKRLFAMPLNCETGTLLRAIQGKCRDDRLAIPGKAGTKRPCIGALVFRIGQEMENGPVVPKGVLTIRHPPCGIRGNPFDPPGLFSKTLPGVAHRLRRDIEDRQIGAAHLNQPVYEKRGPATNVDQWLRRVKSGGLDHRQ